MIIKKKRVRSADTALKRLLPNTEFRVVVAVKNVTQAQLRGAGMADDPHSGDTFLPSAIGPVSDFNANGKYEILKDKPKERRYITTIEWSWTEWHGRYSEERSDFRDIYKDCYPRKEIPAPGCELTYVVVNGERLLISELLTKRPASSDHNLHVINLFLELFGECEIRHADLKALVPPNTKRVNWTILPPGRHPWSKVEEHVKTALSEVDARYRNPVIFRQTRIAAHQPDEVYLGLGGFSQYLAYVFKKKGITILESLEMDNATYIFGLDWMKLSQLTKAEIIQGKMQTDRIIHTRTWEVNLGKHLK